MKVDELKQLCREHIESGREAIILVMRSTRLCGRRGPIGELLSENRDGQKVVRFKAKAVLKWVEKEEKSG